MKAHGNGTPQQCAENLIRIARGEIPFDRLRGVDATLTDTPSITAAPQYQEDIHWLLETYEPRLAGESLDVIAEDAANGIFMIDAEFV